MFNFESMDKPENLNIDAIAEFNNAFMEFLDQNELLVEATTSWSKERLAFSKQGFLMLAVSVNPESFGITDDNSPHDCA